MFYGTITSAGGVDMTRAFTNNFSVKKTATGRYTITFNEYTPYRPVVNVTVESSSGGTSLLAVATCQVSTTLPYTATVSIDYPTSSNKGGGGPTSPTATNSQFSFHATGGAVIYFDASKNPTVTLVCDTITFNGASLMTLSTTLVGITPPGKTTALGKGVALVGFFPPSYGQPKQIELQLQAKAGSNLASYYTLQGWTFGGPLGPRGSKWVRANGTSTELSLDPPSPPPPVSGQVPGAGVLAHEEAPSPWRSPEAFVVVATRNAGAPDTLAPSLSSDPEVTLASMPPGGLVMP